MGWGGAEMDRSGGSSLRGASEETSGMRLRGEGEASGGDAVFRTSPLRAPKRKSTAPRVVEAVLCVCGGTQEAEPGLVCRRTRFVLVEVR